MSARPRALTGTAASLRARGLGTRDRLVLAAIEALSGVLLGLPDRSLHRAAHGAGLVLYAVRPGRRRLVRSNLRVVCRYLDAHGQARPVVAVAARDERALEGLVRAAFGHYVRAYLEAVLVPRYTGRVLEQRIRIDDPDAVAEAFTDTPPHGAGLIFVGLHFGAVELAAAYASARGRRPIVAPMETVANAGVQTFMERARGRTGVRLIPVGGAASILSDALARGHMVGLAADRAIGGRGRATRLFGRKARLPTGPALLAAATGAPAYVAAVRRTGWGEYAARLVRVPVPQDASRRERTDAFLRHQARIFEAVVADAPEQWWTLFFPIWDESPQLDADGASVELRRQATSAPGTRCA